MSDEKYQSHKKLFDLIKSLSSKEKKWFKEFMLLKAKSSDGGSYLELFQQFSSARKYNPGHAVKVVFKGNGKSFNDSCRYLTSKIFECLALNSYGSCLELKMIDKAIEKGFWGLGQKLIKEEFDKAVIYQDVQVLANLYGQCNRLRKHFGIKLDVGLDEVKEERILKENAALAKSEQYFFELKKGLILSTVERLGVFKAYESRILELFDPSFFPRTTAKLLTVRTLWETVGLALDDARKSLEAQINIMLGNADFFTIEEHVSSLSRLVSFYIHEEDYEAAREMLYELGGIEPTNGEVKNLIVKSWLRLAIALAGCEFDIDLAKRGERDFLRNQAIFSSGEKAFLLHLLSINSLYQEEWGAIFEWQYAQSKLTGFRNEFRVYGWVFKAIAHIEQGEYKEAIRQAQKVLSHELGVSSKYFAFLGKFLIQYGGVCMEESNPNVLLKSALDRIESFRENMEDAHHLHFFNPSLWINAKGRNCSILDLPRKGIPGFFTMKMTS